MAKNRTFTELSNDVVTNGSYHVRYVMENDSPRFVLTDIMDSLGYMNPASSTNAYCKRFGLGKVVGADNKLRTYASKEEAEKIFTHLYLITTEFRDFWKNEVVPATDTKYAALRSEADTLRTEAESLRTETATLKAETATLKTETATLRTEAATLREEVISAKSMNDELNGIYEELRKQNGELKAKIEALLKERYTIQEILRTA